MELLIKAHKAEESPIHAVNEYVTYVENYCKETTTILLKSISSILNMEMRKAKEDELLIFKGRIQYSPKTGKPITMGEWGNLENAIIKYLKIEKKQIQKKIASDGYWLGTLLARMDKEQRLTIPVKKVKKFDMGKAVADFNEVKFTDYDKDKIDMAKQLSGIYIQNVDDRARTKIQEILVDGSRQNINKGKVSQRLWDLEEEVNRDWERVVRTEVATNINNGMMTTLLRTSDEDNVFVKGISAPTACEHCLRLLNEKIFVLLDKPPEDGGDKITIDGKQYTALWPGKSNYGRKVKDYWACFVLHPHGRCTFSEWYLELQEFID